MRHPLAITALLLASGCAEYDLNSEVDDTGNGADTGTDAFDTAETDDGEFATEPGWFRLEGSLEIGADGAPALGSSLSFTFVADADDAEAAPTDTGVSLPCTTTPALLSATAAEAPDDAEGLLGWWSLEVDTSQNECPWALPTDLHLGLGAWDPELQAALDASADVQTDPEHLYGAYVQYGDPPGPLWAWGAAGTEAHYDGAADPVDSAPLPSGTYRIEALYLLPWSTE